MIEKNSPAQAVALSSVIILFDGGQLIVPSSAVAEVLPYAPSLSLENGPPWIVGTMLWQSGPIPLISLDNLLLGSDSESIQYRRIIILTMLSPQPRFRYFGLLSTDAPQRVLLKRDDLLNTDAPGQPPYGVLSYASLKDRQIIIPDLDTIESDLADAMRRAGR